MTFPSDAELARRARRDPDAFLRLYIRHAPAIHRWLRARVRDEDAALDLTAETFAQALTAIRRYRAETGAFAAWLHGIAQNLLLVYLRERRVESAARKRLAMPLGRYAGEFEDVDRRLIAEACRAELAGALQALPHKQREALELRVLKQLPYEEIGSRLGCSTGAARVRVTRALRALHSHFEGAHP
jgi:RNA polymerase sigma factor (sigma-70 family)